MKDLKSFIMFFLIAILLCTGIPTTSQAQPGPFQMAVMQGDLEKVKSEIEAGADVNTIWDKRSTPLMYAMYSKNMDVIKLLVEKGADVKLKTEKGGTALTSAAGVGDTIICDFLLKKGAEIETVDNEGKTPLMIAVYNKHINNSMGKTRFCSMDTVLMVIPVNLHSIRPG